MPLLTLFSDEEELSQTHTLPEPEDPLATCPQDPQSHSLPLLLPHPKLFELNSDEEMLERLQKDSDNESLWDWQLSPPVVQEPTSQHMIQSTQEDHASLESNLLLSQSQPCDTHSQSQQQPLTRPMPPLPPPDPLPSPKPLLLHSVDSCSRPASPSSSQKLHIHREPSSAYYDALKNRTFNSLNEKRSALLCSTTQSAFNANYTQICCYSSLARPCVAGRPPISRSR